MSHLIFFVLIFSVHCKEEKEKGEGKGIGAGQERREGVAGKSLEGKNRSGLEGLRKYCINRLGLLNV